MSCFPGAGFRGSVSLSPIGVCFFCGLRYFGSVLGFVFVSVVSWGLFFGSVLGVCFRGLRFLRVTLGSVFVGLFLGVCLGSDVLGVIFAYDV